MHGWEQKYKKFASKYINIIGHKYDRWGGGGGGGGEDYCMILPIVELVI